jgi:hypothetical protein
LSGFSIRRFYRFAAGVKAPRIFPLAGIPTGMKKPMQEVQAPVAMSPTSLGTLYLYEMRAADWAEYARRPGSTALEKVRWLLTRIASRGSAAEPRLLTDADAARLTEPEIEALMEVYLDSPASDWHSTVREASGGAIVRQAGEPASQYFDRLAQWRASMWISDDEPTLAASPAQVAAAPVAKVDASTRQLLGWTSAGLAITALLAAAGLGFAALAYFEAKEDQRANQAWRAEMKALAQRPAPVPAAAPSASPSNQKLVSDLTMENARLRHRVELLEGKVAAASKPPPPAVVAKAAPRSGSKAGTRRPASRWSPAAR